MTEAWLVWSNEHRAWWAGAWGYTTDIDKARRYSQAHAANIVAQANIVPRDPPNEVMVLAPRPIMSRSAPNDPAYERVSERLRAMDQAGEPPFDKEPR